MIEIYGRDAWKVESAFWGGEMGDWIAKRRRIEADCGVSTWARCLTKNTADLGAAVCCSKAFDAVGGLAPDCLIGVFAALVELDRDAVGDRGQAAKRKASRRFAGFFGGQI